MVADSTNPTTTGSKLDVDVVQIGLNLDSATSSVSPGEVTWAMNAVIENFDGQKVFYSNEPANILCTSFPSGYQENGHLNIIEDGTIVFWLVNPSSRDSEIGVVKNCIYTTLANTKCLDLDVNYPILKAVYFKDNCSLQVFWVNGKNRTRYIDLYNLPYKEVIEGCTVTTTPDIDCNKLNVQPDFNIPQISINDIISGGNNITGTYQFAVQYANALKEPYTAFYSVTNPVSLFDITKITQNFNEPVDKSIILSIFNLDRTGLYDYINLAVIKTINNIPTVELVGSYQITSDSLSITYSGQSIGSMNIDDIFQKYEIYDTANDLTVAQDVLIQDQLTTHERLSYQEIANKIHLQWETYRIKGSSPYADAFNVVNRKGYFRDEVYPYEFVPLLKNGKQCDGFTIPGRLINSGEDEIVSNEDTDGQPIPKWKAYNTASILGYDPNYDNEDNYEGPYQYGEFAYWESIETYPCNHIYETNSGQPIRHHRFPDVSVCPHFDSNGYIYPIGVRIDVQQVVNLINHSSLTDEQKSNIQGFKIVRGDRIGNKSIVAKGIVNNVLKYSTSDSISPDNTGTGSIQSSIDSLIDEAIGNISTTIDTMTFLRFDSKKELNKAIDDLNNAKNQPINSEEFVNLVTDAKSNIDDVRNKSNLDRKTKIYLDIDDSLCDAILETASAYSSISGDIQLSGDNTTFYFPNYLFNDVSGTDSLLDNIIYDDSAKSRFAFHSPDTHFYQPSIGDKFVLESTLNGFSNGHIVEVKNHSRYQFINIQAYLTALVGGLSVGFASATIGVSDELFNGTAAFTAYQTMLDIIFKTTPHRNYAYQYNAIGNYNSLTPIANDGNKIRTIDIGYYLPAGVFNTGDDQIVNNFQRESSVYIKTNNELPLLSGDKSKLIFPTTDEILTPLSSYYASIKNSIANQWGQLYSYQTIDTGYQKILDLTRTDYGIETIFGGDCFINKFAFKNKLPLFTDNRVFQKGTSPIDDADISYNEIPNIGKPKYWFSTDIAESHGVFNVIFGIKQHNFFWEEPTFFYDNGKIFLFAYGIPNFFCESEVNVDLRQAYDQYAGDFFPHVSTHIPDEWIQEYNVSINNDNTYWYNKTFSKQNKENYFSHLTPDWTNDDCTHIYPYRAIFSEKRTDNPNPSKRNNWLIYKPASVFDFPQNYGKLVSLDGYENQQVYARFENRTLLYNALSTIPTSTGEAYLGKSLFNQQIPPLDLADTDLGYIGTQHRMFLKTEYGPITVDSKRGQIFILTGRSYEELSSQKYKCQQFFTQNLGFYILKQFPDINIDNNFNGIGLHGVYDARFNRMIITKLDYECTDSSITYSNGRFYKGTKEVELSDTTYFNNKSFTVSFDFENMRWISFHSYLQTSYIGNSNDFYSVNNNKLYHHQTTFTQFNNFNGQIAPYTIEYANSYKYRDQLLQSIQDYSKILKYNDYQEFIEVDDVYFDETILYNNQQCSGVRKLAAKPKGSINTYLKYPIYNPDSITILYTKSNNFYQYNTFWSVIKDKKSPIWISSKNSPFKELNQSNMNYKKLSYQKAPLVAKDIKIRHTLNSIDQYKIISQFLVSESKEQF